MKRDSESKKIVAGDGSINIQAHSVVFHYLSRNDKSHLKLIPKQYFTRGVEKIIDEVISLGNPQNLFSVIDGMRTSCQTESMPCTLIFLDIDGFTQINSTHFSEIGDRVILRIQSILNKFFPGYLLARIGGDEFIGFLINVPNNDLESVLTSLLTNIQEYDWSAEFTSSLFVSVSLGYASLNDATNSCDWCRNASELDGYEIKFQESKGWLTRAYFGLNKAKRLGGGRVVEGPYKVGHENIIGDHTEYLSPAAPGTLSWVVKGTPVEWSRTTN